MPATQTPWQVRAQARYVRRSPRKVKLVVDEIRGLSVPVARTVLAFMTQVSAKDVEKVLSSAAANAEANFGLISDELVVAEAHVGQGPTLKRYRPRARGRVGRIRKPTCHIFIGLSEPPELWDDSSELVPVIPDVAEVVEPAIDAAPDAAEVDAGEPYEGYAGSTAKDVIARVPELEDEVLARIEAVDTRKTVQAQIGVERRKRGLDEPDATPDDVADDEAADEPAGDVSTEQDSDASPPADESSDADDGDGPENAEPSDAAEAESADAPEDEEKGS